MIRLKTGYNIFYATFGQSHKIKSGTGKSIQLKDYYLTIYASDVDRAQKFMIKSEFRNKWSRLRHHDEFDSTYYPKGNLKTVVCDGPTSYKIINKSDVL